MTELDKELRDLAVYEWETFCKIAGEETIRAMKICLMRRKNSSYGFISQKLGATKMQIRYISAKDDCSCNNSAKK